MSSRTDTQIKTREPARKRLRRAITAFCVFLVLGLLVAFIPAFRLQQLIVSDDLRKVSEEQLKSVCDFQENQHLFQELGGSMTQLLSLRYGAVENRILSAFPVIKSAEVRMDWPGTIHCQIVERIEVAWLSVPDGCVMIDKDGIAIEIWTEQPDNIPVIEGLRVQSMLLGQPLTVNVPEAMSRAISLLGAIIEADQDQRPETFLLSRVESIRPVSGRQLYLDVTLPGSEEKLTVLAEIGPDQTEDMLWLRFAMDQNVLNGLGKGLLDLTGGRKTFLPDG